MQGKLEPGMGVQIRWINSILVKVGSQLGAPNFCKQGKVILTRDFHGVVVVVVVV